MPGTLSREPLNERQTELLKEKIRLRWAADREKYDDTLVAAAAVQDEDFDGKLVTAKLVKSIRRDMGLDKRAFTAEINARGVDRSAPKRKIESTAQLLETLNPRKKHSAQFLDEILPRVQLKDGDSSERDEAQILVDAILAIKQLSPRCRQFIQELGIL